jgi:hypothetical protein
MMPRRLAPSAAPRHEHDTVRLMSVKERKALHHPRVEPIGRMTRHFAHDVKAVFEPRKLASSRRRKDRDLAIFALITVLCYVFAIESETRLSVV